MGVVTKQCGMCGEEKPLDHFHKGTGKYGRNNRCKVCARQATRQWRETHPEQHKEATRQWIERHPQQRQRQSREWRDQNRQRVRDLNRKWAGANQEKVEAERATNNAILAGTLAPVGTHPCANPACDRTASDYHHWSYAREHWLSVIPLCRHCHSRLHAGLWALEAPELYAVRGL